MSSFFPLHVKMRVAGNLAGGTREVQSTARRVDPTDATSVSLASLFSYITGLKFELFISMFVGLFCQSVPGHDGSQSLDVGEKKTQKSEAANGQGRMEKVIGSCEKFVKHPFCVIRFATCKGTALVCFSFLFLLKMKVEAGQLNYMKRVHVYCVGIGSIRETFLILPPEVLSKMVGASQKYFCFVFLKTRMLVLLLRCDHPKSLFRNASTDRR